MENSEKSQGNSPGKQNGWDSFLKEILKTPVMVDIKNKLAEESLEHNILPPNKDVFNAFRYTPYEDVKIVILGQDPYPNIEDAHGLAFSSKADKIPKSLTVIFEEIKRSLYADYNKELLDSMFQSPDLTGWAKQGVFLINAVLTVRQGESDSHKNLGWQFFTEAVMKKLNEHPKRLVFMFWGRKAQLFMDHIDIERHLVLTSPHPAAQLYSPEQKFVGNGHFYKAIKFLEKHRPDEFHKEYIDIGQFIPREKIVNFIFDNMQQKGMPNELGDEKDNTAMTRKEAVERLYKWDEKFDITSIINWNTNF